MPRQTETLNVIPLYVTLYDSLEIMGCELREELLKVIKNGHMLFARSEEELLRDFV